MKKTWFFLSVQQWIFYFFLFLGIALRFFQLGQNPASLYWDETAIGLDAYSLNQTGKDMNQLSPWQAIFPSYGDYKAPVYIWLATISVHFFGYHPWAIRLPIALASVASMLLFYSLLTELLATDQQLKKKYPFLPLLGFILYAITPWAVHFGRIGFESSLSVFFFLLCLLSFLWGMRRNATYFLLSSLSAIAGIYTYYSLRVILPLLLLAFIGLYWKSLKQKKVALLLSLIVFVGLLIPLFRSPFYAASQQYRLNNNNILKNQSIIEESSKYLEQYPNQIIPKILYHRYVFMARDFAQNYLTHFSFDFLFIHGDRNLRQHSGYFGELLLICLPFYGVGLWLAAKYWSSRTLQLFFCIAALSPVPAAIVYEVPHASRAIYLLLPLLVIIALGIHQVGNWLRLQNTWWQKPVLVLLLLAGLVNVGAIYTDYFLDYPKRSSAAWLYPYQQIATYYQQHWQEFSNVQIDPHYWFPEIYVYGAQPDLIVKNQANRAKMLAAGAFGLPDPYFHPEPQTEPAKTLPKAAFLYYTVPVPAGYTVTQEFPLLDGQPSFVLAVENH